MTSNQHKEKTMGQTKEEKKDVLIATFISLTEIDDFQGFSAQEKKDIKQILSNATKGGIADIYGKGESLEALLDIASKAVIHTAMELKIDTAGTKPSGAKPKHSRPKWA